MGFQPVNKAADGQVTDSYQQGSTTALSCQPEAAASHRDRQDGSFCSARPSLRWGPISRFPLDNLRFKVHIHLMAKKTLPIELRDAVDLTACTCANLRRAARVVTQSYDQALQPSGLKATQFTLLATLSNRGDLPLTRLAEALVMDRTTLTRNLKPLVGKGYVRVDRDQDQRVRRISLTDAGKVILDAALPLWRQSQSRLVESLGRARWSGLLDDLTETVALVQGR